MIFRCCCIRFPVTDTEKSDRVDVCQFITTRPKALDDFPYQHIDNSHSQHKKSDLDGRMQNTKSTQWYGNDVFCIFFFYCVTVFLADRSSRFLADKGWIRGAEDFGKHVFTVRMWLSRTECLLMFANELSMREHRSETTSTSRHEWKKCKHYTNDYSLASCCRTAHSGLPEWVAAPNNETVMRADSLSRYLHVGCPRLIVRKACVSYKLHQHIAPENVRTTLPGGWVLCVSVNVWQTGKSPRMRIPVHSSSADPFVYSRRSHIFIIILGTPSSWRRWRRWN